MKKNTQRTGGGRVRCVATLVASMAFAADAAAQYGPMAPPTGCNPTPAPPQTPRPACPVEIPPAPHPCHWYPSENPAPPYSWADRRPTAEIRLSNGNFAAGDRSQYLLWWYGASAQPTCEDVDHDDKQAFIPTEPGGWGTWDPPTGSIPNGRPDQFDWLIAQLQERYDRGYRRIVLFMPAGWVGCQDFPASQWWPMALWRRDWFETEGDSEDPDTWGVKGWLKYVPDHATDKFELGVYIGWQIGDPCSICYQPNGVATYCPWVTDYQCPDESLLTGYLHRCWPWNTTHQPFTGSASDLAVVWQNMQPWRDIGVTRFWLDASSGAAADGAKEWREFVNNPNWEWNDPPGYPYPPPTFGGEAFPVGPLNQFARHPPLWGEFNFSPWVINIAQAEKPCMNGAACDNLDDTTAHAWNPGFQTVREAAIFFGEWPKCAVGCVANTTLHPHWDEFRDEEPHIYYPLQRLKNLYEWYICKGHTFWQGDLDGIGGAAERIFGFGAIVPGGDFNGDGEANMRDALDYTEQYIAWTPPRYYQVAGDRLTYYHGDMDSDGDVDSYDWDRAMNSTNGVVSTFQLQPYFLGELDTHRMNWNPNDGSLWLPCPPESGGTMGPTGGPP